MRLARALLIAAALAALGVGCTFLVDFVDQPPDACDGGCVDATIDAPVDGPIDGQADAPADADPCAKLDAGAACGDADLCNDKPTCVAGRCTAHPNDGGAVCGYAGGCSCNVCDKGACTGTRKCPEGYNWDPKNALARCCGGLPVVTNTNANCGVCGVVCKTAGVSTPQDCQSLGGHYLCTGCSANSECWSQCCSSTPGPSHCAASDCNTGNCPSGICPAPSRCQMGGGTAPNFCTY